LDGVEEQFGDTGLIHVHEVRLEETFGGLKTFASYSDNSAVRKSIGLHQDGCVFRKLFVQLQIIRNVTELLLNLAHGLEVGRTVQRVTAAEEKSDQIAGDIATRNIQSTDVVVKNGRFIHGNDVGDTITRVHDDTAAET
jgi:hypothetical protein